MSSPLIDALSRDHGLPVLDEAGVDAFLASPRTCALFFTGDPARYPESNDVAVILPELLCRFAGCFRAAVVAREAELALQSRYGFSAWPALVFLRDGGYLGAITRVRDWSDYLREIENLLSVEPSRPPGIGVPLVESATGDGCAH